MTPKSENLAETVEAPEVAPSTTLDPVVFERWFRQHATTLLAYLRTKIDAETAEEIAQEVWLKLWKHPPEDPNLHVKGWIFKVAKNRLLDHFRRKRPRPSKLVDDIAVNPPEIDTLPEEAERHAEIFRSCLDELDELFRLPLMMNLKGHSHDEIAERVGIPVATSYTRVNRGKTKVTDCVQKKDAESVRKP